MGQPKPQATKLVAALRKAALAHPDVEKGVACEGTSLESTTFKVRKKAFLFLGPGTARLKREEAGWVKIDLFESSVSAETLSKWVDESYSLFAAPKSPRSTKQKAARAKKRRA